MPPEMSTIEPIAILGIGCRYPQADGIEAFWQLLLEGRDAIAPYPGGRLRGLDAEYAAAEAGGNKLATNLGGFLPGIDLFDAAFFGISPREAMYVDPQQRLLLEVSWEALEDAGQLRENYQGTKTGVFTGMWTTDYEQLTYRLAEKPEFYMLTGGGRSTACGRVSFTFGFEGPSVSVDTACSSSMVAIHLACQALRNGECDMALAGGANVILAADQTRLFTHSGMLSKDGHCKFGDASADGFVRSEGAGIVVLKRLSDAVSAGDPIYAVVRGSSVNNDGRSGGLMVTPSREGQKKMLLEAWSEAGVSADEISYIEAHGTGTHAGDPVEIGAIAEAAREAGATGRLALGSIKTNFGHTESAAGVAGVIKAAMVLHEGTIPRSLHYVTPNPEIDWEGNRIEVVTETRSLATRPDGGTRYAGASSFGLTGTNSHMLLGEYRVEKARQSGDGSDAKQIDDAATAPDLLLALTGYSAEALKGNARRWIEYLDRGWTREKLVESTYLAGARRTHLSYRLAAVGHDAAELKQQLSQFVAGEATTGLESGTASIETCKIVFVAPGQGSQWDGMARELYRDNRVFRESLLTCDLAIAAETGWSLIERLQSAEAPQYLAEIDFVQPALFAMSVALAAVWRSAGVEPEAVVGHSMGEVAAACVAGILTLSDAAAVICRRSRLMRRLSGSGLMASVELPAEEVMEWLRPFSGRISIAAENSPGTTVISGESDAVNQLLDWLELKEVFCRRIKVDVASHSALVDSILDELAGQLAALKPVAGTLPFFSTVEGAYIDGRSMDAAYWVRNLREPVRLATATKGLLADGYNCFVELSPHPIVLSSLENTLRSIPAVHAIAVPSLTRGNAAWPSLLRSLGRFWIAGGKLDWATLTGRGDGPVDHRLRLPQYAFERERFWMEEPEHAVQPSAAKLSPFLMSRQDVATEPGTSVFRVTTDLRELRYLSDHKVGGAVVFPASAHLEIALEAAQVLAPASTARICDVDLKQALYLSENERAEVQLVVRRVVGNPSQMRFALLGRGSEGGGWTEHSTGTIALDTGEKRPPMEWQAPLHADIAARSGSGSEHYRGAVRAGLEYGPAFALVESFTTERVDGVLWSRTALRFDADADGAKASGYVVHPALLDNCFQAMIVLRSRIAGLVADDVYLPAAFEELRVLQTPDTLAVSEREHLVAEAVMRGGDPESGTMRFDLRLRTASGEVLVEAVGMTVKRVESQATERAAEDVYVLGWKAIPLPAEAMPAASIGRHWLIFADGAEDVAHSRAAALARAHADHGGRSTLVWPGNLFRPLAGDERRLDLLGADEYELPTNDPDSLDRLLALVLSEAGQSGRISDVVDCWSLNGSRDHEDVDALLEAQDEGVKFVPTLVQAITRAAWTHPAKLWLVAEGTQEVSDAPVPVSLAGSTIWGMGAVVIREHPELRPCVVDLGGDSRAEVPMLTRLLLDDRAANLENRIALRSAQVFAERLEPCLLQDKNPVEHLLLEAEQYRVEIDRPGAIDQLVLRVFDPGPIGADEVAIEIAYGALNFVDVTKVMGLYPGLDPRVAVKLGGECSGHVAAVGRDVRGFQVGDEVVGLTPAFMRVAMVASFAIVPDTFVRRVPPGMSLRDASAQPVAYLTAHLALNERAHLRQGEWLLVHAGAGGVGLAAAQIAQAVGARVIATASSPEKHTFLHRWGVEHVLNSRSLDFVEGVMEITGGRGVDVVLNSLAGDLLLKSFDVLAPYGRFIELGKKDLHADLPIGLKLFARNITYSVVDVAGMLEDKPEYSTRLFGEVMEAIEEGRWAPLPVACFDANEAEAAFRFMVEGRHIGKLAIRFEGMRENVHVLPVKSEALELSHARFEQAGTYILTGGLGGVALAVAEWMAACGAGCLVLVSRRTANASEVESMARMRASGARVEHSQTDLTDREAVFSLIAKIGKELPPLRGIMHAAAAIDDALVTDLRPERFDAVLAPKVRGAWYLHEATRNLPLEFFVMFSSVATIFPQPGHGSYAAANSFLDSFAAYRRRHGLAASSINWTGWVGMGLARNTGTSRTIDACAAEGLGSFDAEEATAALWQAMWANPVHAAAVRIDEGVAGAQEPVPTLLRDVVGVAGTRTREGATEHPALTGLAAATTLSERMELLEQVLRVETGRVLKLAPERIGSNQAFGQLGIDSLMALELIRRVNAALGLALPATAVFNYPTLTALATQILKRLGMDTAIEPSPNTASFAAKASAVSNQGYVDEMLSDEEAMRALMQPDLMESGEASSGD